MGYTSNSRRYWYDENVPHMVVINPVIITKQNLYIYCDHEGPVYLRFGRPKVPNFTPKIKNLKLEKQFISRR